MFAATGVTRLRMATMILVLVAGLTASVASAQSFNDVPETHLFHSEISWLAAAGITLGCNPPANDMFCPDDAVTRGQMAAFLVRALGLDDDGGGNRFVDDDGSVFEEDIARLAAAGITLGCNPPANDMFCPDDAVTRGQMAAFLHRALARPVIQHASLALDGLTANSSSTRPFLSADGRYVAFTSYASDLVLGDNNGAPDVFVRDLETGEIELVSRSSAGEQADGFSYAAGISGDGTRVVFVSFAPNLVPGDSGSSINDGDVFVRDRSNGTTVRASISSDGSAGNHRSWAPDISANGRYVAFESEADNLVANDTNDATDVFVHDLETGDTTMVSRAADGTQGDTRSFAPRLSGDGALVVFTSDAFNLTVGDTQGQTNVYLKNISTGAIVRVSIAHGGGPANGPSVSPDISADGRYVAFHSSASNLVASDTNHVTDVFLYHVPSGEIVRVSESGIGVELEFASERPTLPDDGAFVIFQSQGRTLVPEPLADGWNVYRYELATSETEAIVRNAAGELANREQLWPAVSGDGRYVAFESSATNLVPEDTSRGRDIFVRALD